jgi:hypothetical protein
LIRQDQGGFEIYPDDHVHPQVQVSLRPKSRLIVIGLPAPSSGRTGGDLHDA